MAQIIGQSEQEQLIEDEAQTRKLRQKVMRIDSGADVHEFEKDELEDDCCGADPTSSVSTISTTAPTEGMESMSMCFSGTVGSLLEIRQAGEKYRGEAFRQRNLSLCMEEPPVEVETSAVKSTLSADAPEFYMTDSVDDGKAKLEPPLNMEPVKITSTSVGTSPSSRMSDGSVAISRFGVAHVTSVGSKDHGNGLCKPCAWYHKEGSCKNGKDCFHCHLCPAGEIKARKKAKGSGQAQARTGTAPGLAEPAFINEVSVGEVPQSVFNASDSDPLFSTPVLISGDAAAEPPAEEAATDPKSDLPTSDEFPSIGAQLHPGECRPCAWFYKPEGCKNGKECHHCHLCPKGELKNRKKKGAKHRTSSTGCESKDSKDEKEATKEPDDDDSDDECQPSPVLTAPPGLGPIPTEGSESAGSDKHGTGECRPCAWYWKPGSCANGKECMHCHLCSEDEIKKRKKAKIANLRSSSKEDRKDPVTSGGDRQKYRRSSRSPQPNKGEKQHQGGGRGREGNSSTPPPPPLQDVPPVSGESGDEQSAALAEAADPADLPSSGSALHALGKCKPCAWHWKPGGCTNGNECCHCHLCPPGELKGRRKAKESAMRVGALVPKRAPPRASSHNARAMPILKIFPLL